MRIVEIVLKIKMFILLHLILLFEKLVTECAKTFVGGLITLEKVIMQVCFMLRTQYYFKT